MDERLPLVWSRECRRGEVLLPVRRGARRIRSGRPCRAEDPHRPVRRPRRLHVARGAARSRGRAGRAGAVSRAAAVRARALGRNGGEVHRRCGDGAIRRAGDARGRSRARGPCRAGDPRLDRGGGQAAGADRGEHGRGAGRSRGTPGGGGGRGGRVGELCQSIEGGGELMYWRQGRSLPYGQGVSYWALAEMVKAQAAILETDSDDEVEAKLTRAVEQLIDEDAEWVLSHLRPLVGQASDGASGSQEEAFTAWRRFFEALAEQRPLVLVFEDIQWADDGLLDFVEHLVDWARDVPVLILCTARLELLERRPAWGGGKLNAAIIALAPLSDEETAKLIATLSERVLLEAETQSVLLDRAGGNPLYAEQFVRMLAERGAAEELSLPETVQGIIAARLDSLAPDEKALLQDAAVIGKVFWLGAL